MRDLISTIISASLDQNLRISGGGALPEAESASAFVPPRVPLAVPNSSVSL